MAKDIIKKSKMTTLVSGANFTSRSLDVPNLQQFQMFLLSYTNGAELIGLKHAVSILYGGYCAGSFESDNIVLHGANYAISGNTITINQYRRGYTNGQTSNYTGNTVGLAAVYGIM